MGTKRMLNEKALVNTKPLSRQGSFGLVSALGNDDKTVTVKNLCTHSIEKTKCFFCNKLNSNDGSTNESAFAKTLMSLNGREVPYKELPMEIDSNAFLEVTSRNSLDRLNNILGEYGEKFQRKSILKCRKTDLLRLNYSLKDDLFRVFIKWEDNTIRILVLDPWHHMATDDFERLYKENKSKYRHCIENLK